MFSFSNRLYQIIFTWYLQNPFKSFEICGFFWKPLGHLSSATGAHGCFDANVWCFDAKNMEPHWSHRLPSNFQVGVAPFHNWQGEEDEGSRMSGLPEFGA